MGFVFNDKIVKPIYNPSGCSCKFNPQENEKFNSVIKDVLTSEYKKQIIELALVWDCSNLVTNGQVGFISTKILDDNPDKTKEEIIDIIGGTLQIIPILIENNKYDKFGQISGFMQFVNKNTIAISKYPEMSELAYDNRYLELLVGKASELGLNVIRIREIPCYEYTNCLFSQIPKNCSLGSKGTYINFLILNQIAIIPEYNFTIEEEAWECNQFNKELLSGYFEKVIQVNCDELAKVGGLLNSIFFIN